MENANNSKKNETFADLLEESFAKNLKIEGSVVKGKVVSIENDIALVDVGLKSEGRISMKEFSSYGAKSEIQTGDLVDVFIEKIEGRNGDTVLSREKAKREEAWSILEIAHKKQERVTGIIFGKVKGGFTVDLEGATAFLPGSQVDIRPIKDLNSIMGGPQSFMILKMDRKRGNIVVSRRAVLEESRAEARTELVSNLGEGQVLKGIVKNITDYGAFIDLGGVDGLLHVTDIAWKRVLHPSEVLKLGDTITVQVIKFNNETQRISLGMKQLEEDPWTSIEEKYPIGSKTTGRITNITDYGAFVELDAGIEGLVHVTEISWTKKNIHPGKIVSTSEQVEVMVLDIEESKRRISLGLKQCVENPWQEFLDNHPNGSELEGEIKNITEFGIFVAASDQVDGLIHLSDISWEGNAEEIISNYKKGDVIKTKVLDVSVENERISLGIKQLEPDPFADGSLKFKRGMIITCIVEDVLDQGLDVEIVDGLKGFIRKSELSRDREEQRPDRFAKGDKVDAQITNIDKKSRKITLSIKAREILEEKKAMKDYGSSDSGATLGDILGVALNADKK
ncbi:MAG: 30S ribosomal protein S1 [Alphaproteobacteria bacterium]|nr:MAG: 30S ribosomal protein S1 [Alphaproteobacteria bacterium]